MVLPLSLLRSAQGHPMLVELKNGDTYNGHLVNCDSWMNLNLKEVICTSRVELIICFLFIYFISYHIIKQIQYINFL